MIALMIEALKAQTQLMSQLIGMADQHSYDVEINVYNEEFDDEEDEEFLEEGPLSEEEIAEWVIVPEGTDPDVVIDIVRQVEEIYGIVEEDEEFDWEDDEESDDEEAEEIAEAASDEEEPIEL